MYCAVYRSSKKPDTYLYLAEKDRFDCLPQPLRQAFGQPTLVLELTLSPARRLAQEDVRAVLVALLARGWFLQLPRQDVGELLHPH
ncbi:MAG TPA: YcgL domain-containing protein [Candidatus Competibacteraceae bacterium]|nr:YcgL domain-containing protein [Candidatus Competibacteraceae bacterium]